MGIVSSKPITDSASSVTDQSSLITEVRPGDIMIRRNQILIANRYRLKCQIGSGTFGQVFEALDLHTNIPVAVKTESIYARRPQLEHEYLIYKVLRNAGETSGFAKCHYFGTYSSQNVLVLDYLGPSLQDLIGIGGKLSLAAVLSVAIQAITRLQLIHHNNFVHRDVKPGNLVLGREDSGTLFLIDFGLSKRFRYNMATEHVPLTQVGRIVGTPHFLSINAHLGFEQGRRDDLESLGYTLIYLSTGRLPWSGIRVDKDMRLHREICRHKQKISLHELCVGIPGLETYFRYVRSLQFEERPKYRELRALFRGNLDEMTCAK